jgi:hypothetical protein
MRRRPNTPFTPAGLLLALLLAAGCSGSEAPDDMLDPARGDGIARIRPAAEVLEGAHIPTLDPARLNDAEIAKALGPGPKCLFRYTRSGRPVLAVAAGPGESRAGSGAAVGPADAVIKLNGDLVVLEAQVTEAGTLLAADGIRLSVSQLDGPDGEQREATAILEIGDGLRAGYRGYAGCSGRTAAASGA